jgi:Mrp family chromosome partitioning ATPase/capsular polysaccharide biosynthesis protein
LINTRQPSTLRDYLQIARRRLWIILTVTVLTVVSAAFFSARQEKLYQASAKVLVSGIDSSQPPDRFLQTQADIATASPEVARRVRKALRLRTIPPISVTPNIDSDILVFSSTAANPRFAARVANAYGEQFSKFQRELATRDVKQALRSVEAQIKALGSAGAIQRPTIYSSLVEKRSELLTLEVLQTTKALLVQPATLGVQVQPKLVRNTFFGLLLGLIVGLGLALLREALDTRVRSTDEIAERLGIPLLARLPKMRRQLRLHERLVMVSDPDGPDAEAFRILRASVDFARMDSDAKTLMVTSAGEGEGKSTTAANLAVTMARSGQHVILVDLDLRRPFVHRFFNLNGPGIAHVATGHATLEEALAPIPLVWPGGKSWNGDGGEAAGGLLEVLPAAPMPANLDDVVANQVVKGILEGLRQRADVVVVDSTPLFAGDAMALAAAVEGILIVVGMDVVRRPTLRELRRVLEAIPTRKFGFIAASDSDASYSGYGRYHRPPAPRSHEPVA